MPRNSDMRLVIIAAVMLCRTVVATPGDLDRRTDFQPGPMLARFLEGPMADFDEIVFAVRVSANDHCYANFGHYVSGGTAYGGEGGRLSRLNLRKGELRVLFEDPTYTLKRLLGEVPVHEDGSAYMEVPAMRSLFFVALDAESRSEKRMHSFVTLQPGETTGCVGCHEQRVRPPRPVSTDLLAMGDPPAKIQPIAGVPEVFDYLRDIQPILDRHCVECHNAEKDAEGRADLSGETDDWATKGYMTMAKLDLLAVDGGQRQGNIPPYETGSSVSPLIEYLDGSHHDAKLSEHEHKMVRLWIDASAPFMGTYGVPLGHSAMAIMRRTRPGEPGYRPPECYTEHMKLYGILPKDLGPDHPVDPYATDRKYWASFHPVNQLQEEPKRNR
jgi:hypothetical protein